MGQRPEPLNGIYRGKTHSQGFVQIAEPPAQNVDECRAQGFNMASLTTDLNASLNPLRQPFLNPLRQTSLNPLRQPFLNPPLFPAGHYLHYRLLLLRRPLRPGHLTMKALFLGLIQPQVSINEP